MLDVVFYKREIRLRLIVLKHCIFLIIFLFSSISSWKSAIKIFQYDCGIVYFSVYFCMYFKKSVLLGTDTFILVLSFWYIVPFIILKCLTLSLMVLCASKSVLSEIKIVTSACVRAESLQSCLILCDPVDCSPPGSSVHGIFQARMLEWVAMPSSRGSSRPRDRTHVSYVLLWQVGSLPLMPPGKPSLQCT